MINASLFWAKVDTTGDCWLWTASCTPSGYGTFHVARKSTLAHRVSYLLSVGPIPQGLEIDHTCRNRRCVRPEHLEPVTPQENMLRWMLADGRGPAVTHCPRGHEYTPENTYLQKGWVAKRSCIACRRLAAVASRTRVRARRAAAKREVS